MAQASRRVFVVGAFFCPSTEEPMKLSSLPQLHSYRGRRGGAMPFGRESWCLVTDSDAVSSPTKRSDSSGGSYGAAEGSIPSSTTEHLNNDRVVQRRRAGRRSLDNYRPAPSSPLDKSPARSGGTLAPTLFASSELLR